MPMVGSGNVTGWHYTKKNCEETNRNFLKEHGIEVVKYNLEFREAREYASSIRFLQKQKFIDEMNGTGYLSDFITGRIANLVVTIGLSDDLETRNIPFQ